MAGWDNDTLYGKGLDLSGNALVANKLATDGFLYFGNSAGNPVAGLPTSINDTISYLGFNGAGRFENRRWATAFVVDSSSSEGSRGTYTTIQAAVTAASFGDTVLVRYASYTEDVAMKDGVNVISMSERFSEMPDVTGKFSMASGSAYIKGLNLKTNGDYVLSTTGTSQVNLIECPLDADDNTLIEHTSTGLCRVINCGVNLNTTGVTLYSSTGSGAIYVIKCSGSNGGGSTTASSKSAGETRIEYSSLPLFFSTTSTATALIHACICDNGTVNNTCLTTAGTGISTITNSKLSSGTASVLNIGSGTEVKAYNTSLDSSNANVVTGAGQFSYSNLTLSGTSTSINPTTSSKVASLPGKISFDDGANYLQNYEEGSWTPGIEGSTGNPTVGLTVVGKYTRIGNVCYLKCVITINTISGGSGVLQITGVPFTASNDSANNYGTCRTSGVGWDGATDIVSQIVGNTAIINISGYTDNAGGATIDIDDLSNTDQIQINMKYWV